MTKFIGFFSYVEREIVRYLKSPVNSLVPNMVSTFLYLLIFGVGLGARISSEGTNYLSFLIPGLIVLNIVNGSYLNASSSVYFARWFGYIRDILTSPLSYTSMIWAIVVGSMSRGFLMGFATWLVALPFVFVSVKSPFILLAFIVLISILFSGFGIVVGLWADDWEQLNIFLHFMITPLIFLGGVFYSLNQVPAGIALITKFNPLFYMVNGVRYAMTGQSDVSYWLGILILLPLAIILLTFCFHLFKKGWHLRT